MDFAKQKSQTNQNADFGKPDFDRKATKPTQPTTNKTEATKQSHSKPMLTKIKAEKP
jgi:hypothetical protein